MIEQISKVTGSIWRNLAPLTHQPIEGAKHRGFDPKALCLEVLGWQPLRIIRTPTE